MTVRVAFRDELDNLTSFFATSYKTVAAAKKSIEKDAAAWLNAHNNVSKHDAYCGIRRRPSAKWMDTKRLDYYKASAKDGSVCFWQYFVEK